MSETSKKIEIEVVAIGGDAAADEIGKVNNATEAIGEQTEAVKDLGEASAESADKAEKLEENVSNIARAQKAQAVATLAADALKLAQNFRSAADEVEEFDKDAAVALRNTAKHIEDVSNGVSTVASGFAAGGPAGAALASLGVLIQALATKWKEGEVEALKAAASEKAAMGEVEEATRNAATAAEERATAIGNAEILGAMDAELSKAREITAELQRQTTLSREKRALENELLDARDRSNLEKVGLDEASGKITPDHAAEKRDAIESGARKRDREERKRRALEDAILAGEDATAKTSAAGKAKAAANALGGQRDAADKSATDLANYVADEISQMIPDKETGKLSDSDKKFVAEMEANLARAKNLLEQLDKAVKEATAAAAKAEEDAADARTKAGDKTTTARETVITIDAVQVEDDSRLDTRAKTRGVKTAQKQAEEEQARKRKEESQRQRDEESAIRREGSEAKIGRDAVKLLPSGVLPEFRKAVEGVSKRLQDGDQGGEIEQLTQLLQSLASSTRVKGTQTDTALQQIRRDIGMIKARQNNMRTGR
jgi:hypothetical protein